MLPEAAGRVFSADSQHVSVLVGDSRYESFTCGAAIMKTGGHNVSDERIAEVGYGVFQPIDVLEFGVLEKILPRVPFVKAPYRIVIGLCKREHPHCNGCVVVQVEVAEKRFQFLCPENVLNSYGVLMDDGTRCSENIVVSDIADGIFPEMEAASGEWGDGDSDDGIAQEILQRSFYTERLQRWIVLAYQVKLLAIADDNLLCVWMLYVAIWEHELNVKWYGRHPVPLLFVPVEMENVTILPTPRIFFRFHKVIDIFFFVVIPVRLGACPAPRSFNRMVVAEESHTDTRVIGEMTKIVVGGCFDVAV